MSEQPATYQWRVHLAKQSPDRLPVVVLVLIGAPMLGWLLMGHWLFGVLAFWMVLTSTADYLFPMRFEADELGIRQRGWTPRAMNWDRVKRVVWGEQGVLLSPFEHPTRLNAFRGVFLWYGDHRELIEQLILERCRKAKHDKSEYTPKRKRKRQTIEASTNDA